jgi:tripartite-type tricarboxylate transporter receptor subunit TctC
MKFAALSRISVLLTLAGIQSAVYAADYPSKPIRMIVGFAAGGGTDTTARAIAQKMSAAMGEQVVVDNRPGAAGNVATELVVRGPADGYTILMGTIAALAINPTLYGNLAFDPIKDLAPVSQAVNSSNILVVHPSVQAKSVQELIALAKAKPGTLNYGSSGIGGTGHLAGVLFDELAGTKMTHVPYKGGGPAMIELVGGQVQLVFATPPTAVPQIKSGKIRGLAVTTLKRSSVMPDLPTISESGLKGYDANNWYGVVVPVKTPKPIVTRLNTEIVKALNAPDLKELFFTQGLDPAPSTPEQFGAYIKSELGKWAKVIKASGAKAD